jgi:hypothetical protein
LNSEEMSNRFSFLKEGEVIYVCSTGLFFNKGDESERRRRARHYCFDHGLDTPVKVVGKAEAKESENDIAPVKNKRKSSTKNK